MFNKPNKEQIKRIEIALGVQKYTANVVYKELARYGYDKEHSKKPWDMVPGLSKDKVTFVSRLEPIMAFDMSLDGFDFWIVHISNDGIEILRSWDGDIEKLEAPKIRKEITDILGGE